MRVQLFVTCLVDQFRPSVGEAAVSVLERCGCQVEFDPRQTCCGQPAYNSGHLTEAKKVVARTVTLLDEWLRAGGEAIVCPSGSCTSMLKHAPELLESDEQLAAKARNVADHTWEFASFLVDVLHLDNTKSSWKGSVTWHDACHGLRELGLKEQPRKLLAGVKNLTVKECSNCERCCGFGGTFSVTYPEISGAMADDKIQEIEQAGVDAVVASDISCLLHLEGRLSATGSAVKPLHIAQLLSEQEETP